MNLSRDIIQMHQAFQAAGHKLYVVGGAVRDHLLGLEPKDVDLATDALPEQIIEILSDYKLTKEDLQGKSFGVVRVRTKYFPDGIEIATFRKDITSGRQPQIQVGATIEEDVVRRDLTINALFYDIAEKKVIDLVGGVSDLEARRIYTPGKPLDRFNEDGLRVIRAIRFKSRIGGYLDDEVIQAIAEKNPKFQSMTPSADGWEWAPVAKERIWDEFQSGLEQAVSPHEFVSTLIELNVIGEIFQGFVSENAVVLDSRKPEIMVAGLMLGRFSESQTAAGRKGLISYLKFKCYLTDKQANGAVMLMRILGRNVDEVYDIYRGLPKTELTFADVAQFMRDLKKTEQLEPSYDVFVKAVSVYGLTVKSSDLQAEGFFDTALGEEKRRRETELFTKLLN